MTSWGHNAGKDKPVTRPRSWPKAESGLLMTASMRCQAHPGSQDAPAPTTTAYWPPPRLTCCFSNSFCVTSSCFLRRPPAPSGLPKAVDGDDGEAWMLSASSRAWDQQERRRVHQQSPESQVPLTESSLGSPFLTIMIITTATSTI